MSSPSLVVRRPRAQGVAESAVSLLVLSWGLTALAQIEEPSQPTATASESNPAIPAAGHSIHGEAFNDGPRAAAVLLPGQGRAGFKVSTTSEEAQRFFNQGVAQLHSFYYLEAERSFRQAAKLDPACPMTYWGMAMANVNNAKRAKGFLKEALKRAETTKLTRHEQLYLDALAAAHKEKGDDKSRRQDHLKLLETIVQEFPDDLDARAWLAMAAWQNSQKGDGIGSRQAVDELIESVLRIDPAHPGALHYRIHLWDGHKQERAVKAANAYGPAAPGIAHAWHMPGHTFSGLQRYPEAAYQQEASARADHAAMARDRTLPFEIHNYAHNNQWLCTTYSHIGRVRDAIAVARNLVEQPRDPQKNGKNDGGSPQRSGRARWTEVLVRYELWDDLVRDAESGAIDWSDIPLEKKERPYNLGLAYAHLGDASRLAEQIQALKNLQAAESKKPEFVGPPRPEELDKPEPPKNGSGSADKDEDKNTDQDKNIDKDAADDTPKDKPADTPAAKGATRPGGSSRRAGAIPGLASAIAELEGHQLLLEGKHDEALKQFEKATGMRPEAKIRALLRCGQVEKAVAAAKSNVEKNPNQLPPLACQVETLAAVGKDAEAREAFARLAPMLRLADADLPIVRRVEAIAARWKEADGWSPDGSPDTLAVPEDFTPTTPLERLGPLCWSPTPAEPFTLTAADGSSWALADHRGRNVIILFYLGGKCAHCLQQLQEFGKAIDAFKNLDADLVAVSTDDLETTRALKANADGVAFPMPLLADPKLEVFRRYKCFDDFEDQPLHGTFFIDVEGNVRFRRIAADPFLDIEFLKGEIARVNRILRP